MSNHHSMQLYRQLMRHAYHMKDYNFRSYAIRRIKIGYEENKHLIPKTYVFKYIIYISFVVLFV